MVEPARAQDERGFFARLFTPEEFAARGLDARVAQVALSYNRRRGTLRCLHYQAAPHAQAKLVRCTCGAVWDVIVDLRPASPAFRRWFAVELTARDRLQRFVPAGCAHGFVSLEDEIVQGLFGARAAWLGKRTRRSDDRVPAWLGKLLVGIAQRTAERQHARTRRELLRIDDHLSDLLAFTGRPE